MTAHAVSVPFRTTESLMAMAGIVLGFAGAVVLGLVVASDPEHGVDNWNFAWIAPAASLAIMMPAAAGAAIIPLRAWTGGVLVMGTAVVLIIGATAATSVLMPLGLLYLPAAMLLWRAGSRAIARRGSEEIIPGPRPYLVWAAGGLAPILAFLLIASALYEKCTAFTDGTINCERTSLGDDGLVLALIGVAVVALVLVAVLLAVTRGPAVGAFPGSVVAALPAAAALAGIVGLAASLELIGLLALALVAISVVLFFLPTQTRAGT